MSANLQLQCPVRGVLKTSAKRADGLKPSEEFHRVEAIKHLIARGYPKANFKVEAVVKKFGNAGRNSLRADFAVLDVPANTIDTSDVDELMAHALVLCEVKRESTASDYVKSTQVSPLLDFAKRDNCIGLYWDNVDQRVFWNERSGGKRVIRQGPITLLPRFGRALKVHPIKFKETRPADDLLGLFDRIENILHTSAIDPEQRFHVILQILLAKLYDEHAHAGDPDEEVSIQDYRALGMSGNQAISEFSSVLDNAAKYYQKYLPNRVSKTLNTKVGGEVFMDIAAIIAPFRLISSKRDVVQSFYMRFAKGLYKWDLAQYFTPPSVTEFIVDVLNPQFGEHIKDPACGSADFLTAAFHRRRNIDPGFASCIWGADNSKNAVQVAVLNMLLNGDGKSNIKEEDSLEKVEVDADTFQMIVCNPPFGIRIQEKRKAVLRKFDLGHTWSSNKLGIPIRGKTLLAGQETGLLFTELCVKQAVSGGRIAIILPNGYLGNRSDRYRVFRDWLLRHCRIVAICSFPRFTFKTSGADVSASVVYLEKRTKPLRTTTTGAEYSFSVQMIENVGWNLGDKKAAPRYVRNLDDGSFVIDAAGERVLDADFASALDDLRASSAGDEFSWLRKGLKTKKRSAGSGWSVSIKQVTSDPDLTLDPKRYSRKVVELRSLIATKPSFEMGDLVDIIQERRDARGKSVKLVETNAYKYVELQDIGYGEYGYTDLRGWQLPQRARHFAEAGDIYVGGIWGSVSKWCYVGEDVGNLVVTNGCYRLRIKTGMENQLEDLLGFLCTEAYAVQMRSFARGSDGLAEVTPDDLRRVLVPKLSSKEKKAIKPFVDALRAGAPDLRGKVTSLLRNGSSTAPAVPIRPSHVVLV